jgi:hypothetical protein
MTTDRTDDRSETEIGTAQEPNASNEQVIAELCEALQEIEAAALRNNGPLARDYDSDMLRTIGKRAELARTKARGAAG